ncbi:MAG TPA: RlmE family RNA methyltransferase, partial [Anaeromyxobacteraceae bacterium]|nr:RlmE family RNA methyltransferase [Anaeromyxobacteraceae bacterium]
EIVRRHRLVACGQAVLDLGAAPGGFLEVLAEAVGERGSVLGIDLEPIHPVRRAWVKTAVLDVRSPGAISQIRALHPVPFDLVTSDLAPKTIGVKVTDEARSLELCRLALAVAKETLRLGGSFVTKVFMGGEFSALRREVGALFEENQVARPRATRQHSCEVYLVGKRLRH